MFDIITFGSATRDVFIKSKKFKVLKDKRFITGKGLCFNLGSKIYLDDIFFATGGGGTNTAATFVKQGLKTALVSKIGNDPGGQAIIEEMNKMGVECFASEDIKRKTNYSVILSASKKDRTILAYHGASHFLEKRDISFKKLSAKWFYIASFSGKSANILFPVMNFAKKKKIKVALNPSAVHVSWGLNRLKNVLSKVDVLLLNQEEASILSGIPYQREKEIFKKLDKYVPGIVVMTKGPKGVVVSDGKYIFQAGTFKEKRYVDRTGAGDAFGSGFVSGLLHTGKVEEAIRLGSANGTSIVEQFGAKNGILSKRDFQNKRWKNLKIDKKPL